MITTYPTFRTAVNRIVRHRMLSLTQVATNCLQTLGMNLRVDETGNYHLLDGWLFIDAAKQADADLAESLYASAIGVPAFQDDSPVIGERSRSWSHSIRRKTGLTQT